MLEGIQKAALIIAHDNGMINRTYSQDKFLVDLQSRLDGAELDEESLNEWFLGLSDEELQTVCAGEEDASDDVIDLQYAPDDIYDFLDLVGNL